jgi:hypothetical protein
MVEMVHDRIAADEAQWFQRLLYCDVESKWKSYHIITFPGQSLSKNTQIGRGYGPVERQKWIIYFTYWIGSWVGPRAGLDAVE